MPRQPLRRHARLAGDEGVWFFIAADLALFALLFAAFLSARLAAPALFEQSRQTLSPAVGTLNTVILVSSSWLVALAVRAARARRCALAARHLAFGILVGAGFAVSKIHEYGTKIAAGITLQSNEFFMYYYALTGLHFLHFAVGMVVLAICWHQLRHATDMGRSLVWLESSGCYWHMVDLLWIVLFPLLYLLRLPAGASP